MVSRNPDITIKTISRYRVNWRVLMGSAVFLYIISAILLFAFQERIIFHPQDLSNETIQHIRKAHPEADEISITTKDGSELKGWFVRGNRQPEKICFYYGGNGDEASRMIDEVKRYPDWSFVLINYRGYGSSNGSPSEKTLFSDALEIYDSFITAQDINYSAILVMGRSIGSGVAVYVAHERPIDGIILSTPYDSVLSVAQEKLPIYPINLLLRNKFDSIGRAPSISKPTLVLIGSEDKLIPPRHTRQLMDQWGGEYRMEEIAGENHYSIVTSDRYWLSIKTYLDRF